MKPNFGETIAPELLQHKYLYQRRTEFVWFSVRVSFKIKLYYFVYTNSFIGSQLLFRQKFDSVVEHEQKDREVTNIGHFSFDIIASPDFNTKEICWGFFLPPLRRFEFVFTYKMFRLYGKPFCPF